MRFYTYESTLGYFLEAAAKAGKPIVVLDRPESHRRRLRARAHRRCGPRIVSSATGRLPVRHGMTVGELARMFNGERVDRRKADRRSHGRLDARRLVRFDGPDVDQSFPEYAQPDRGHALSG